MRAIALFYILPLFFMYLPISGSEVQGLLSGETYRLTAKCSGKVLAVQGAQTGDGINVRQWTNDGGPAQQWEITYVDNGAYKLIAACSGKALTVANNAANNGDNVEQQTYMGAASQTWNIVGLGDGWFKLVNAKSGMCLDVNGAGKANGVNIQQWDDNGSIAQSWQIELAALSEKWTSTVTQGTYRVISKNSNLALDVSGASQEDGANVQQWTDNGTNAQRWDLKPGEGPYALIYAIFLKGALQGTASVTSGYTETIQAHCPMDPTLSQEEIERIRSLSRQSAIEVLDNNLPALIISVIRGAAAVLTNGIDPLKDPLGALNAFGDLAKRLGESANKAVTDQTKEGIFGPLKNPPGLANVKTEYDDVKEYAKTAWSARSVDLVQWQLDDPKVALTFQGNQVKYGENLVNWVLDQVTSGIPEPAKTVLINFLKNRFPDLPIP